jgi:GYF domain 2
MNYYYADNQNRTAGPIAWEQIGQRIRNGLLSADPMVIPEGGSEWRPYSTWDAPQAGGAPAAPNPAPISVERPSAAPRDTRAAIKILATNPVGGLSAAFENLGPQRAMGAGIVFCAIFVLSCVLAGYRIKSAIPGQVSLASAIYFKAFALTVVPFASLFAANFATRMFFRAQGGWRHDCFVAGASILPLAFPVLVACVVGLGENPIVFVLLTGIFAASLGVLILFAGLTQIYKLPIRLASFMAPAGFALMTLAVHLARKILFSGGLM